MSDKTLECYEKLYSEQKNVWGSEPLPLVKNILKYKTSGSVLDLGAGEGRNSLFLASKGFNVEAIDFSDTAIEKLKNFAKEKNISVKAEAANMLNYEIEGLKDIIVSTYIFHHLTHDDVYKLIKKIKTKTNRGGLNVISAFLEKGDLVSYSRNFLLAREELKNLYSDWKVLEYEEKEVKLLKKKLDGGPMFNISAEIIAQKP